MISLLVSVALRKESVDRNLPSSQRLSISCLSLSARRAWIEMGWKLMVYLMTYVALRKESVDRNGMEVDGVSYDVCRSPQGERG